VPDLSQCFFLDTRLLGAHRRVVFPLHLRKIEFADSYYLLWRIGVHIASAYFFELATALYIISIHLSSKARDRLRYLLLGSGILDHTLLMADANYTTNKRKLHIERSHMIISRSPITIKNPFPYGSRPCHRRRFSLFGGFLERNLVSRTHTAQHQNVHILLALHRIALSSSAN
jgi:hypothetical protein